jgi:hypothetical protein
VGGRDELRSGGLTVIVVVDVATTVGVPVVVDRVGVASVRSVVVVAV